MNCNCASKRRSTAALLLLIALLGLLSTLWFRGEKTKPSTISSDLSAHEKTQGSTEIRTHSNEFSATEDAKHLKSTQSPLPSHEQQTAILPKPTTDYRTESFDKVPEWIPRPGWVLAAVAENATLRSDGYLEGTVRYTLGLEPSDATQRILSQLESSGLQVDDDGKLYRSESPPRRCEIQITPGSDGDTVLSLHYQATDHEKGCRCPTCGGA